MFQRNKEGATLALTVTAVFFIVLLGVGFFFLVQLLGGGREAQHATDSGNLNVAKQALVKPAINPAGNEGTEFAGLFNVNNQADLKDYDRYVGKALLVALNASEEGTPTALAHAQTVISEVEGKGDNGGGGIGERLYTQLNTVGQTTNFFDALAKSNSLRMLNWHQNNQTIATDPNAYHVSFMRQNADAATNVHILPGVVPPASQHSALTTTSTNYMVGYTPITVTVSAGGANSTLTIYGVPVRPNQEPHLVSQQQFLAETTTDMPDGTNSFIPPNAFQCQSNALEMHGGNVQTRSSAIVGVIDSAGSNFNAEIPQGYIVINNTGSASDAYNPTTSDPFAGQLMGAGVFMAQAGPNAAFFSTNPSDFTTVAQATYDSTGNIPMSTLNGTNFQPASPAMTQSQLNSMHDYLVNNGGADQCNNINSFAMESGGASHPVNPNCETEVADVYNALRTAGGGPGQTTSNLMAIEYLKSEVIRIRGCFDGDGCGSINPSTNLVTGLKSYSHPLSSAEINRDPFGNNNDTTVPTIGQLLAQTNAGGAIQTQIRQRLNEMHAAASSADLDAAFNQPVPFDKISYLYWNGSAFASTTAAPTGWNVASQAADGNTVTMSTQDNTLSDRYINVSGDGGFPHPFDCPPAFTGFTKDSTLWTPGSGFNNLLGVIQFTNTADVGVTWCCPC